MSANWKLPSLGRWDCDANVFDLVANKTGYKNAAVKLDGLYFNMSYPGPQNDVEYTAGWWSAPLTDAKCASGLGVLKSIVDTWGNTTATFNYTNVYPYDENSGINTDGTPVIGINDIPHAATTTATSTTATSTSTSSTTPSAKPSGSAAGAIRPSAKSFLAVAALVAALL